METARQERLIGDAKAVVSIDRCAAEVGTVIAFLDAEKLGAPVIAAHFGSG